MGGFLLQDTYNINPLLWALIWASFASNNKTESGLIVLFGKGHRQYR